MEFQFIDDCNEEQIQRVVRIGQITVVAVRNGKLVFVKCRGTVGIALPRILIGDGEEPLSAIERLMTENLGMTEYKPEFLGAYTVTEGAEVDYGMLYFADVSEVGPFPHGQFSVVYYLDLPPESNEQWAKPVMDIPLFNRVKELGKLG